eukprot:9470037-Pyramimonas_sp.AAC.1
MQRSFKLAWRRTQSYAAASLAGYAPVIINGAPREGCSTGQRGWEPRNARRARRNGRETHAGTATRASAQSSQFVV